METITVHYKLLLNDTFRAFKSGDRLTPGWSGQIEVPAKLALKPWGAIFDRHNKWDRPDSHLFRSLSVGDIVIAGETAMAVEPFGWREVPTDEVVAALTT